MLPSASVLPWHCFMRPPTLAGDDDHGIGEAAHLVVPGVVGAEVLDDSDESVAEPFGESEVGGLALDLCRYRSS